MPLNINPGDIHAEFEHEMHLIYQFVQLMENELAPVLSPDGQAELLKESSTADIALQRAKMLVGTLVTITRSAIEQRDEAIYKATQKAYNKLHRIMVTGFVDTVEVSEDDALFLIRVLTGNQELPEGLTADNAKHALRQLIEDKHYLEQPYREDAVLDEYETVWKDAS
jgi:hypothetical protein